MNAIDDIGQKVGVVRKSDTQFVASLSERDEEYALRVLQKLYRTYQSVNAPGWTADMETNEYSLATEFGRAYICRRNKTWAYEVYLNSSTTCSGTARYLEKAMQICSLALAE